MELLATVGTERLAWASSDVVAMVVDDVVSMANRTEETGRDRRRA
jgi:hypothetical protein